MTVFIDLKFSGNTGDRTVKNCIKKLKKCFYKEVTVKFVLRYRTTKLCYFTNTKDKTPFQTQSSVTSLFAHDVHHVMLVKKIALYMRGQRNTPTPRGTRSNKAQFMNICQHEPITATLQIYSRLIPIALIATSSRYRK